MGWRGCEGLRPTGRLYRLADQRYLLVRYFKRLNGNDVFLRMHKTKKLMAWAPDFLVDRLRQRAGPGRYIFFVGQSMNPRTVTEQWRIHLRKPCERVGRSRLT